MVGGHAGAVELPPLVGAVSSVEAGVGLALVGVCGGQNRSQTSTYQLLVIYLEKHEVSPW